MCLTCVLRFRYVLIEVVNEGGKMSTAKKIVNALTEIKRGNSNIEFPIVGTIVYPSMSRFERDRSRLARAGIVAAHYHRENTPIIVAEMVNVSQLRFFASCFFENLFAKSFEEAEQEDVQVRRSFIEWVARHPRPRPNAIRTEVQIAEQKQALKELGISI